MPVPSSSSKPRASTASSSPSSSRMPSLLEPHISSGPLVRDQGSLTTVTWVQGASANWLVLRYLYALLATAGGGRGDERQDGDDGLAGVVLVSFLRDVRFWTDGCVRLGMDLDSLRKKGRFTFVDGLTGLYATPGAQQQPQANSEDGVVHGHQDLSAIKAQVDAAVARLSAPGKKILIVDGIDAYVALTSAGSASDAENLLMSLRENVFSTLLTLSADEPLMQAAGGDHGTTSTKTTTTTSLERAQAALVLGQAHAADQVVSLRRLDTGAAADVSGVLRVTTRRQDDDDEQGEELLHHVSGDGSVRVFERGA